MKLVDFSLLLRYCNAQLSEGFSQNVVCIRNLALPVSQSIQFAPGFQNIVREIHLLGPTVSVLRLEVGMNV
jgi:hypothetical protein